MHSDLIDGGGFAGETARDHVPPSYRGPCAMAFHDRRGVRRWAIFPTHAQARDAAAAACRQDLGGYDNVAVHAVTAANERAPSFADVTAWLFGDEEEPRSRSDDPVRATVLAIGRAYMRDLARRIAAAPGELADVHWRELERLLFEVFDALKFDVRLTRGSKDGGYDLELEAEGQLYLIEVKHWAAISKVGDRVINGFTEVVMRRAERGLLLSTSGFTDTVMSGRMALTRGTVMLGAAPKIVTLCECMVASEAGLVVPRPLAEVLFDQTF